MSWLSLQDVLKKAQKQLPGFGRRFREAGALSRWEKAVGPQISKHSRAIRVKDKCLWVLVDHPVWKSELHHRKKQILKILNGSEETEEILEDLFFVDQYQNDQLFTPRNKSPKRAD